MRHLVIFFVLLCLSGCFNQKSQNKDQEEAMASEPSALEDDQDDQAPEQGDDELEAAETAPNPEEPNPEEAAPAGNPRTDEAFTKQPRMEQLQDNTDPEFGEPETTEWQESERNVPDSMTGSQDPAELLLSLSSELRLVASLGSGESWEHIYRVRHTDDDEATGMILRWGFKDDSLIGSDLLVEMSRDDGQWYVDDLQERFHCLRGVSEGQCL